MTDAAPSTILADVVAILRTSCRVERETFSPEDRLQEDLGLDSMGLLSLALEVENHFRLMLDESPESPPRTLGELVDLIRLRQVEQAGSDARDG